MRKRTPRRARSQASTSPAGPAPAIRTSESATQRSLKFFGTLDAHASSFQRGVFDSPIGARHLPAQCQPGHTMQPHERLAYSAIESRPPLKLPDGLRLILWPLMSLEQWDISRPIARMVITPPQD